MSVIPNLADALKEKFSITENQWKECVSPRDKTDDSLVKILIDKGLVDENALLAILSEETGIPCVRIRDEDIDEQLIKTIPAKVVIHYNFMPLKLEGGVFKVAVNDPLAINVLDEIKLFLGREIQPVIAARRDIGDAIKNFYGVGADTLEKIAVKDLVSLEVLRADAGDDIKDETIDPSVIKFLNQVLLDAIKQRATDIHFEPFEDELRIRHRVDGVLHEVPCPESIKHFRSSIASRIKVTAKLDITERRRPQDGRVKVKMGDEIFDLRISVLPTPFGESIGIRILSRNQPMIGLEQLGLEPYQLKILEEDIYKPNGIVLVTGPTGSGKTTTLYTCLSKINSSQRKILTVEDPIEYQLKGITQIQIEPKVGLTFVDALRSMLRHDPDVMMVGEIRDVETAELAVRTSLTGHLVFSTLHTNNAASSITRLLDMGIDSFLVSSSVNLVIAQRLVRLICVDCKEEFIPVKELLKQFNGVDFSDYVFYHGRGCDHCRFTGYHGRIGIFEMLIMTEEIREMVLKKMPAHKINQKAVSLGMMKVLALSGLNKVKKGLTTLDEVLRVTNE